MKRGFRGFRVERAAFTCRLLGFHRNMGFTPCLARDSQTEGGSFWEKVLEVELQRAPGSAARL